MAVARLRHGIICPVGCVRRPKGYIARSRGYGRVKPWETDLIVYEDEPELLVGLRRGDRLACTCLLKRFAPRLYRLALHLMGDADEAEDVLQEAFIRACTHIAEFDGRSSLGTWLHRIVRNSALMRLRARPQPVLPPGDASDIAVAAVPDRAAGPGEQVLDQELGSALERAILALPDTLRAAFVLRHLEGLSTASAASTLGISESALKVRLHRARHALQLALADANPPERWAQGSPAR